MTRLRRRSSSLKRVSCSGDFDVATIRGLVDSSGARRTRVTYHQHPHAVTRELDRTVT